MHVATFGRSEKHSHLRAFHIYSSKARLDLATRKSHTTSVVFKHSGDTSFLRLDGANKGDTRKQRGRLPHTDVHSHHLRSRSFFSPHTCNTGRTRSTDLVVAQLPRTTGPNPSATPHSRAHADVQRVATRSACMCVSAADGVARTGEERGDRTETQSIRRRSTWEEEGRPRVRKDVSCSPKQ